MKCIDCKESEIRPDGDGEQICFCMAMQKEVRPFGSCKSKSTIREQKKAAEIEKIREYYYEHYKTMRIEDMAKHLKISSARLWFLVVSQCWDKADRKCKKQTERPKKRLMVVRK